MYWVILLWRLSYLHWNYYYLWQALKYFSLLLKDIKFGSVQSKRILSWQIKYRATGNSRLVFSSGMLWPCHSSTQPPGLPSGCRNWLSERCKHRKQIKIHMWNCLWIIYFSVTVQSNLVVQVSVTLKVQDKDISKIKKFNSFVWINSFYTLIMSQSSVTFITVTANKYNSCKAHQPSSPWWSHWGPLWFSLLLDRPQMVSLI